MAKLELGKEELDTVKALLKKWVPGSLVLAYGSRVKGTSHEGSDLDLVIKNPFNSETPTSQLLELKQSFSESNLPILIDIMDWAYLPSSYRNEIEQLHVVVQSAV